MADGTRFKSMDDRLNRHEETIERLANSNRDISETQVGIRGALEQIVERLTALEMRPVAADLNISQGDVILPIPGQEHRNLRHQGILIHPPKWEFPSFEGHQPKVWLRKCERYFNLHRTADDLKVEVATLYLNGMTETWYNSMVLSVGVLTWVEFKEELCIRFGEILMEDVVEVFNKLNQTGSVDEYLGRFEDLKAEMLIRNLALNEAHFLSSFMGGLKEEIKYAIKMFKPTTLALQLNKPGCKRRP
ncbi:hypothetical protein KY290_006530 [Solanum tuberosum]|uniref:Retrotransposon gag domain-containing protein n=1 Tax=Solanum tuberosum TaxID=4113 RepID=A0ABQ7WJ69_SOLTU|nr:hypothetical protein KY284_005081 [Solanum tuberosum]KAH0722284.1 hypothetical protein KY289_005328 [Solanum tuberosum]KAH0780103.1 hypothetical protein KY290_006530 [Solanum tuberosum]